MSRRRLYAFALAMILLIIAGYGFWLLYAPQHLMTRVSWATAAVDGQPVLADFYIGDPTHNEAEAFLLVHVPNNGDYMLSFGNERYRAATVSEYVHVHRAVWMFKPIQAGNWYPPLSFQNLNEFRINSRGHLVTIRF